MSHGWEYALGEPFVAGRRVLANIFVAPVRASEYLAASVFLWILNYTRRKGLLTKVTSH